MSFDTYPGVTVAPTKPRPCYICDTRGHWAIRARVPLCQDCIDLVWMLREPRQVRQRYAG